MAQGVMGLVWSFTSKLCDVIIVTYIRYTQTKLISIL